MWQLRTKMSPLTFTDVHLLTAGCEVRVVAQFKPAGGEQRNNIEEVVRRL